ncbi:hypothetical protein [Chitinimonas sp. BJYL2]|uniref:hypothetical protein n=1 Tax=Chitinimonas sp. BJYL2 TaxID=2976696 RepID=UPI0022B41959|nr:hypothetical protein [Chitinimonas sp. BJYL2]
MAHPLRQRAPLWFRIGGLLALVIAFVVALLTFLNYANFRKTVQELHQARYLALGKDLRQSVEAGLSLGLLPDQNARLPALFAETRKSWPAVSYVGVIDPAGKTLAVAGQAREGELTAWADRIDNHAADASWYWQAGSQSAVGLSLTDNYGGKAGAIVIAYDDRDITALGNTMLWTLLWRALGVMLAAAALAWLGAWWLTRQLAAELDDAEAVLAGASLPPDTRQLVAETQHFVAAIDNAQAQIGGAR